MQFSSPLPGFIVGLFCHFEAISSLAVCGQDYNECFEKNLYVLYITHHLKGWLYSLVFYCLLSCVCMAKQWILCWFIDLSGINIVQTFKAYYYWRGYWFLFSWGDLLSCNMWCHYPHHCLRDKRLVRGQYCCRFCFCLHNTITYAAPRIFTLSCTTFLLTSRLHKKAARTHASSASGFMYQTQPSHITDTHAACTHTDTHTNM